VSISFREKFTEPLLLDTQQASDLLGLSRGTIRRLCRKGTLRGFKLGGKILIASDSLERSLRRCEIKPEREPGEAA